MVRGALAAAVLALSTVLVGCGDGEEGAQAPYDGPPIPWAYQPFPSPVAEESEAAVELGRLLFYDPILSGDQATACATCHSEIWGLSDGLARSVGVDGKGPTGPGRTGPNVTRRNAQTLWNVAFRRDLFWDGREHSLEAQALAPLLEPGELGLSPESAVAALKAVPEYVALFARAFPKTEPAVSEANLGRALAAFQRTLVTDRAPYDQYVAGDAGAIAPKTRDGMGLFAEARCHSCHVPPLFDSESYAVRVSTSDDPGRYEVTGKDEDFGAFRTPTLRNTRDSEPFFHDGSAATLREAVARELDQQVQQGASRVMSDEEIDAITVFIDKALTDRSRDPNRPKHVPSGFSVPKDGFRIPR